jgi:hypothetical protein
MVKREIDSWGNAQMAFSRNAISIPFSKLAEVSVAVTGLLCLVIKSLKLDRNIPVETSTQALNDDISMETLAVAKCPAAPTAPAVKAARSSLVLNNAAWFLVKVDDLTSASSSSLTRLKT